MAERNAGGRFVKGHQTNTGKKRPKRKAASQVREILGEDKINALLKKLYTQALDPNNPCTTSQRILMDRCFPVTTAQMEAIRAEIEDLKAEIEEEHEDNT